MKTSVGICHTCSAIVDTHLVTRNYNFEHNNTPCGLFNVDVYVCDKCDNFVSVPKHTYRLVEERKLILNAHAIYHSFSNPMTLLEYASAVDNGMVDFSDLIDGQWYVGYSRNTTKARYKADTKEWFHYRYKWGMYIEDTTDAVSTTCTSDMFVPMHKTIPETKHMKKEKV